MRPYSFSSRSETELKTCHEDLQRLFREVIRRVDCTILDGHRGQPDQDRLFAIGKSRVRYPMSRHNADPSEAVDVAPYPIDWDNHERFCLFAGFVLGVAHGLGIEVRWGGDWLRNFRETENRFNDLVHFELVRGP